VTKVVKPKTASLIMTDDASLDGGGAQVFRTMIEADKGLRLIPLKRLKALRELESVLRNAATSGRGNFLTRTAAVVTCQRPE
jgi:hypothetical protein